MSREEYITVKEYAEIRGCSVSAVYKRLKTTLQPFVVKVEGQTMLKRTVLEADREKNNSTPLQPSSSTPLQPSTEQDQRLISLLEQQISDLKEQLKKQEQQAEEEINFLKEQISIKDLQIDQQQKLNAMFITSEKLLSEPEEKKGFFRKILGL